MQLHLPLSSHILGELMKFRCRIWTASELRMTRRLVRGSKRSLMLQTLPRPMATRWIWIDTCCIDKNSSAELSEAINSMYRWYENATVCYAHIEDCPEMSPDLESHPDAWTLQNTRWARRGWTLQELIAPKVVLFYTEEWKF